MDHHHQAPFPTTTASQPSELPEHPQPPSSTTTSAPLPSSPIPIPSPNPNPDPKPLTSLTSSQPRPHTFNRTWQQPYPFSHFSSHLSSSSAGPSSSSASPSIPAPSPPRAGMAIGVPAHHSISSPQPAPFSSSFGQQFGGLGRSGVNAADSASNSSTSQVRQPMQGMQGMGMMGSLGSGSQMRPGGVSAHHQQRPVQPSLRPPSTPNNQSPASPNFQGHALLRVSSVGSPGSLSPSTSQSMQPLNQPWLSSGSQGKPPLPSPSYRPQINSQTLQQRSHIPQQHHPSPTGSHQHMSSPQPQQPSPSHQPHEHYGQQFPPSRVLQSFPHQQQITRVQGPVNQKPAPLAMVQSNTVQQGTTHSRTASLESEESCNRILSKRSIHDLVSQIDPSERLDPEVEDILVDIADEFVESITTFGCSLAKHRKSSTLEAKDILLHLERNWNMNLPGFSGDEIKSYRKPLTNDIHKERLAAIKKSIVATETANAKNVTGQVSGNAKSVLAKMPANAMGSANLKINEVT